MPARAYHPSTAGVLIDGLSCRRGQTTRKHLRTRAAGKYCITVAKAAPRPPSPTGIPVSSSYVRVSVTGDAEWIIRLGI